MRNYTRNYSFLFVLALCLFASSCASRKAVLYNPSEVKQLSSEMGFYISNSDENIPLYAEASLWLGVPYRYAGLSRKGVDCSGFVNRIYKNVYNMNVSRATTDLEKSARKVSKRDLQPGDLVFFATSNKHRNASHVGIFLKDGYFVHASTSRGVIVSHLNEDYYQRTWKKGGRIR